MALMHLVTQKKKEGLQKGQEHNKIAQKSTEKEIQIWKNLKNKI
jgi:hypothetical protein